VATLQSASHSTILDRLLGRAGESSNDPPGADESPKRQSLAIALSILISCMLWFTFTMQETYVRVVELPTEVVNLPADVALAELPPQKVRVEVRGPGWQLLGSFGSFGSKLPVIPIDASLNTVNLEAAVQALSLSNNVSIQGVSPTQISLQKEDRIMVTVPVQLNAIIEPPPTHDLVTPPVIIPDSVTISGARSVIGDLMSWPTEPFEALDLRDSIVVQLPLADTLSGLVTRSRDSVTLIARAKEFPQGTRELPVQVRGLPNFQELVRLEPPTIMVRYRVPIDQYDAVERAPDFYAEVSYEEILNDTTGAIVPRVNLPREYDVRDVELFPPSIRAYQIIEQ